MARCWLIAPPQPCSISPIGVAVLTAIAWWFVLGWDISILRRGGHPSLSSPVRMHWGSPCRFVLANTTAMGAKAGILVHDRMALEEARTLDTIVFDKTGTLTEGEHSLVAAETAEDLDRNRGRRAGGGRVRAIPNT